MNRLSRNLPRSVSEFGNHPCRGRPNEEAFTYLEEIDLNQTGMWPVSLVKAIFYQMESLADGA